MGGWNRSSVVDLPRSLTSRPTAPADEHDEESPERMSEQVGRLMSRWSMKLQNTRRVSENLEICSHQFKWD